MDEFIKFIFSGENLRTILVLAAVVFGFGLISVKMDKRFMRVEKCFMEIDKRFMALEMDMKGRFMEVDKRFISLEADMKGRFMALETNVKERFTALEIDIKERFAEQDVKFNKAMDKKLDEFYARLKSNDFDHINRAIEALTFTLSKNSTITESDKNFVERNLDL